MRTLKQILLLALVLLGLFCAQHQALGDPGEYRVSIDNNSIMVTITSSLAQNVTQFSTFSLLLQGQNSSTLAASLTSSIQNAAPKVSLDETRLQASSNGTVITMDLQFRIIGAVSSGQAGSQANLAWRSFKIEEDLQFGEVMFNLVGKHYLEGPLLGLVDQALNPTTLSRTTFQLNGERAIPLEIQQMAPNLNILDFSALTTPLTDWSSSVSLNPPKVTWEKEVGFDIVATTAIREPLGEQIIIVNQAAYRVNAIIDAPGPAQSIGESVFFGQGIFEPIMIGIIAALLILSTTTFLVDRRLTSRQSRSRRK